MQTNAVVKYIVEKNPIKLPWWPIFYGLVLTGVALWDVITTALGGPTTWKDYFPVIIQMVGLLSLQVAIKKINDRDRTFFWWKTVYSVLFFINSLIFSLWIGVIKQVVGWAIDVWAWLQWSKPKATKDVTRISLQQWGLILLWLGAIIVVTGLPIAMQPKDAIFYNAAAWGDAVGFASLTAALILNVKKKRESKIMFLISSAAMVYTMAASGQTVTIAAASMGVVISLLSMVEWYHLEKITRNKNEVSA